MPPSLLVTWRSPVLSCPVLGWFKNNIFGQMIISAPITNKRFHCPAEISRMSPSFEVSMALCAIMDKSNMSSISSILFSSPSWGQILGKLSYAAEYKLCLTVDERMWRSFLSPHMLQSAIYSHHWSRFRLWFHLLLCDLLIYPAKWLFLRHLLPSMHAFPLALTLHLCHSICCHAPL